MDHTRGIRGDTGNLGHAERSTRCRGPGRRCPALRRRCRHAPRFAMAIQRQPLNAFLGGPATADKKQVSLLCRAPLALGPKVPAVRGLQARSGLTLPTGDHNSWPRKCGHTTLGIGLVAVRTLGPETSQAANAINFRPFSSPITAARYLTSLPAARYHEFLCWNLSLEVVCRLLSLSAVSEGIALPVLKPRVS